ncbi:MAG: NAD(P)(+) transhydrogenase (Re/Si-specific) subunit beta [Chloroflexi bacterium]|nr:NAD(P)(+) transhydrogenase (Re/Si-specific) subunit beta [Chloroflexota bacterium]
MIDFTGSLPTLIQVSYLVAAGLFIFGLKRLGSVATAKSGNLLAATGMLLAVVATLVDRSVISYGMIAASMATGAVIGAVVARTVKMTAMPQMVAIFNGLGGGASALVASAEFLRLSTGGPAASLDVRISIILGVLIGAVTLTGSIVAYLKLEERINTRPITYPLQNALNLVLFLAIVALSLYLIGVEPMLAVFLAVLAGSLLLGVLLVIPIGGADMPVVISLLNSYSGLAAAAAGFVLGNAVLIIAGALVGASGIILTRIMSKAMNRSLTNIIFGAFGTLQEGAAAGAGGQNDKVVREVTPEEAAMILGYARSVIVVPGYGLAVAQAQHVVRELADLLEKRGADVKYAIHPVAGRMPGHMNVLLAEADVPYDRLYDLDQINSEFERADVAIVVGANDVTNPAARNSPDSPLYGMPILNVDKARSVLFLKRSMNPGFAGIDNDLFYLEKTMMLFGDAKQSLTKLVHEVESV